MMKIGKKKKPPTQAQVRRNSARVLMGRLKKESKQRGAGAGEPRRTAQVLHRPHLAKPIGEPVNGHALPKPAARVAEPPAVLAVEPFDVMLPISLERIFPSETNRKHFDADKLQELAKSIKADGVQLPIVVRKAKAGIILKGGSFTTFTIVAGERRWRASKIAGLTTIPTIIRDVSEEVALVLQITENAQREDLDPIEAAHQYQILIDKHGHTAAGIAQRVNKSKTFIYAILRLTRLNDAAAAALRSGRITRTHCEKIAAVPDKDKQSLATAYAIRPRLTEDRPATVAELEEYIQTTLFRQLKLAVFDRGDATLIPKSGSCTACPKMTGNNRDLYPDARGDVCTDPHCYADKERAYYDRVDKKMADDAPPLPADQPPAAFRGMLGMGSEAAGSPLESRHKEAVQMLTEVNGRAASADTRTACRALALVCMDLFPPHVTKMLMRENHIDPDHGESSTHALARTIESMDPNEVVAVAITGMLNVSLDDWRKGRDQQISPVVMEAMKVLGVKMPTETESYRPATARRAISTRGGK